MAKFLSSENFHVYGYYHEGDVRVNHTAGEPSVTVGMHWECASKIALVMQEMIIQHASVPDKISHTENNIILEGAVGVAGNLEISRQHTTRGQY